MKVSGQFQNIERADDHANIRSYIETCYRNNVNGHEALIRLMNDNPYTLEEILEIAEEQGAEGVFRWRFLRILRFLLLIFS